MLSPLLAPALAILAVLLLWPLIRVVLLSFQDYGLRQIASGEDNYIGSGFYLNSGDCLLSPLGQDSGDSQYQSGQLVNSATVADTYCPIHLGSGSNYFHSATPTSTSALLNGGPMVDLDCDDSTQMSRQFEHASRNANHRHLELVAGSQRDSKSDESPIAIVGSLSDFLNMNTFDDRTMNLINPNGSLHQSTMFRTAHGNRSYSHSQSNSNSLGNRAANKKRVNKVP